MSDRVMQDMRQSMEFVRIAQPILKKILNGGEIMAVESQDNEICEMLDRTCGTDYFHVYKNLGLVWGVASRIQKYNPDRKERPFNSFTVRKARDSGAATEYEKRKTAIERGGVYPFLTMQAYINVKTNEIETLAIVKTQDLMDFVDKGLAVERHTGAEQYGQAAFFVVYWDSMKKAGYKVIEYKAA